MKIGWFAIVFAAIALARVAAADELLGWDVSGSQNFGLNGMGPNTIGTGIDSSSIIGFTRGSGFGCISQFTYLLKCLFVYIATVCMLTTFQAKLLDGSKKFLSLFFPWDCWARWQLHFAV